MRRLTEDGAYSDVITGLIQEHHYIGTCRVQSTNGTEHSLCGFNLFKITLPSFNPFTASAPSEGAVLQLSIQ